MTTTRQPGATPTPQSPEDDARLLVARLAAEAATRSVGALPAVAAELGWLATLPPAVRRTVIADVAAALSTAQPDMQQREVAAALSRGRDLASRFAHRTGAPNVGR